jgi:hypothetical protein
MSDLDDLFPTLSSGTRSRSNLMARMVSRVNKPERADKVGVPLNLHPLRPDDLVRTKVLSRKPEVKHKAASVTVDGIRLSTGARLSGDDLKAQEAAVELSREKWDD